MSLKKCLLWSAASGLLFYMQHIDPTQDEGDNVAFNVKQFRSLIERTLAATDPELNTPSAVELLLGTAAQETHLGTYLRQVRGPAFGVFQCEPTTFQWLQEKFQEQYPVLKGRDVSELEFDLRLAILMARLRYRIVSKPLPDPTSPQAMAEYWKRFYNGGELGKGKTEDFIANYKRFVLGEAANA